MLSAIKICHIQACVSGSCLQTLKVVCSILQGSYIMFHHLKGTPYDTKDQGANCQLTNWEQIDNGEQYTATRNFLTAIPVAL